MSGAEPLVLTIPEEAIERIAERAAALVLECLGAEGTSDSPYVSVDEAAAFLRAKRQRVYDLLSAGRLTRYKDGRRTLVSRAELDAYLVGKGRSAVAPALPVPPRTGARKRLAA